MDYLAQVDLESHTEIFTHYGSEWSPVSDGRTHSQLSDTRYNMLINER